VLEGTTSGLLIYGREKGLVTDAELHAEGVDLRAMENFRQYVQGNQNLDLAKAKGEQIRAYLEMHQEVAELVRQVRSQWGPSHPLVRGFEESYFTGDLEPEQQDYLYKVESTIQNYLYSSRH
jgi:hypothetical protein